MQGWGCQAKACGCEGWLPSGPGCSAALWSSSSAPGHAGDRPTSPFTSTRHNLSPKMDGTHFHNCHPWLWALNVSQLPTIGFISTWIAVTNVRVTLEECWISRLYIKMVSLTAQYEMPFWKSTGYNLKTATQIYSFYFYWVSVTCC